MDKYVVLVTSLGEGMLGIGPFDNFEEAAKEADLWGKSKTLVLSMRPATGKMDRSIGEVSDLLQALARASAVLYEEAPLLQFDSIESALEFIAHSIDEPMVREHMLGVLGVKHGN